MSELAPADLRPLLEIATLCNDASLEPPARDPLEVALLEAAGVDLIEDLSARLPRVGEAPFDSERKRMSTLHTSGRELLLFVKGPRDRHRSVQRRRHTERISCGAPG